MTAIRVPPPPLNSPFLDGVFVSKTWRLFLSALYNAVYSEGFDKVDAGYQVAKAAVPQGAEVLALGGLHLGGKMSGNVAIALYKAMTAVASLPAVGVNEGDWAYAYDGRKVGEGAGAGTGVPVWRSSGSWRAVNSGAVVAA